MFKPKSVSSVRSKMALTAFFRFPLELKLDFGAFTHVEDDDDADEFNGRRSP